MKRIAGLCTIGLMTMTLGLGLAGNALAADEPTREMARIVADLNHRPSADDKEKLRQISESGSPAEQAIADALLGMNHKVSPNAKERLGKIASDDSVPQETRELASILKDLNHHVSDQEKAKLRGM